MNRAIDRRGWLALVLSVPLLLFAFNARAHHGWGWASAEVSEISGVITAVRLGNPHGEITLDVNGERWVVEVGQPWRNERAGLSDALLSVGRSVTAHGHRSARPGERLLKANWLMIDGQRHVLYPERQ
ncbi:MAG TPA: DUF6152 family protein [Thauera sp.]|uniref:DUF6152 family protein n=1 Tax=Thauera sp. TaxID=1905334 RepID=UPI002BD45020|nr:DUF6152 family protein [Thauera sp.]HRP24774.1 DUF6152 family protein [Thauera sp.]HRP65079.1 DUF6152 family protein [Thauera sp.]